MHAVDKSRESKPVEVQKTWDVYDDRLEYLAVADALLLDDAVRRENVSDAWMLLFGAGETALADAYCFPVEASFMVVMLRVLGLSGLVVERCVRLVVMCWSP